MIPDRLTDRDLNRATLARQLLLQRRRISPLEAVSHLVGLQAQNPLDPYLGLWSRVEDFDPNAVGRLLEDRFLVRMVVLRGTIHLVTADDSLLLRPLMQPVLDAELARHSEFAPLLVGVDLGPVLAFAAAALSQRPLSGKNLRSTLSVHFPDVEAGALAYACRCLLPLVQVPPRGVWGKALEVTSTPVEAWLGRPLAPAPSIDALVMRYLAAFGPATVADVTTWSRLSGLAEVLDRLRPRLRTFKGDRARELFDLPEAPRPDPDVPAPVRFLPEYDNLLLSHKDRARFGPTPTVSPSVNGVRRGAVLVDGRVAGWWHAERESSSGRVSLIVEATPGPVRESESLEAEARRVGGFWQRGPEPLEVRIVAT